MGTSEDIFHILEVFRIQQITTFLLQTIQDMHESILNIGNWITNVDINI